MKKYVDYLFYFLIVSVSLFAVFGVIWEVVYWKKIYSGIHIGSTQLGYLSAEQAGKKIEEAIKNNQKFTLKWGVNEWIVTADELGLQFNISDTVNKAMTLGRSGNLLTDLGHKWNSIISTEEIELSIKLNQEKFAIALTPILEQVNIPAVEPSLKKEANNNGVAVSSGENGREIDLELLRSKITNSVKKLNFDKINIPVTEIQPQLTDKQVEQVKIKAQSIINKKLKVEYPTEKQTWEIGDEELLAWLDLKSQQWNRDRIENWIEELSKNVNREPQNAALKFVSENKVEEFKPAKDGIRVLSQATLEKILETLPILETSSGEQKLNLVTENYLPEVATSEVNTLGIKELIGKGESWFSGSITNRIFNLKKSADALDGILVAPGEVFSFNKTVGEISTDTGYKQAYIIKEGKTILGDGGGVCQVSSTLFRAVLNAGLPIESRTAHAYRVSYYEEKYQPGFDATIFQPNPDFSFKNDTNAYLLIQTVYNEKEKHLMFELYGTHDGRVVELSKARIWDSTPPPPDLYIDDPTLENGKVIQTEHSSWGAKVAFDWKVTRNNEVLQQRTFYSNYRPWQAVYRRGTKV